MTKQINVGGVPVGGGAPVTVQSMCNTNTADVETTSGQILRLEELGCDIVRVAVPDMDAAFAIEKIKRKIHIPIVADIHFDYRLALASVSAGADKVRINPGNIGSKYKVGTVAEACKKAQIPIRVGVNGGSLEKRFLEKHGGATAEALVESAMNQAAALNEFDFDDICVSIKSSSVPVTVSACRLFAEKCQYPLHVGVTETGGEYMGLIKSSTGIGALLLDGIGDTIRVSLTAAPESEVKAGISILKAAGIRKSGVNIISCPTCGRTKIDLISLVHEAEKALENCGRDITVAIMGCVVNGPGEAKAADYGIAGGEGEGVIFAHGKIIKKLPQDKLICGLMEIINDSV